MRFGGVGGRPHGTHSALDGLLLALCPNLPIEGGIRIRQPDPNLPDGGIGISGVTLRDICGQWIYRPPPGGHSEHRDLPSVLLPSRHPLPPTPGSPSSAYHNHRRGFPQPAGFPLVILSLECGSTGESAASKFCDVIIPNI